MSEVVDLRGIGHESPLSAWLATPPRGFCSAKTSLRLSIPDENDAGRFLSSALALLAWTYGELNPALIHAMDAFYR